MEKRIWVIYKAVSDNYYSDLGETIIMDDTTIEVVKIQVIPNEGIHKNVPYIITIKFQEEGTWPLIYIDSEIFDRIKTRQYLQNRGKTGDHKGICIENLSYNYTFNTKFREICDNKWENYLYYLIITFNNIQDFEKGNGIRSDYKQILFI